MCPKWGAQNGVPKHVQKLAQKLVQKLVKNFDDKGVTLTTKQEADSEEPMTKTTDPADATVDQMAKRATNAAL